MSDECLSWNPHIEMIGIKIPKAIGIINNLKLIYPQRILFTGIIHSLFHIIMLYGNIIIVTVYYCGANQITCKQLISYRKEPSA